MEKGVVQKLKIPDGPIKVILTGATGTPGIAFPTPGFPEIGGPGGPWILIHC